MYLNVKGHNEFLQQAKHWIKEAMQRRYVVTSFLSIPQQNILLSLIPKDLIVKWDGGYEQAERKRAILSLYEEEDTNNVCALASKYDHRFQSIEHKDLLGALMALGIEREVVGDLLIEDDRIIVFTTYEMASFIQSELTCAKRTSLSFQPKEVKIQTQIRRKEMTIIAPSLRLDSVVSQLAHCSRSKAKEMLKAQYVKVNDIVLDENTQLCDNDFVSIRKVGRFQYKGIDAKTKKDRLVLRFEQYI